MNHMKSLRSGAVLLLTAASFTALLSGCGWRGQSGRDRGQDKTYIVVVDAEHSVLSELDRLSNQLDALLGEDWVENTHPIFIVCQ